MEIQKLKAVYGSIDSSVGVNEAFIANEVQVLFHSDIQIANTEQAVCFFIDELVTKLTGNKPDFILIESINEFSNDLLIVDYVISSNKN